MRLAIIIFLFFGGLNSTLAQIIPEKSPLFAEDIYIDNEPNHNQRQLAICSAFNGWLYAAFSYPINNQPWVSLMKSTDNGKTWSILVEGVDGVVDDYLLKIDLIACGNDTSNLKLFYGEIKYTVMYGFRSASVTRFSGKGEYEHSILNEPSGAVNDIALATDYMFPAGNSNPNSIAVVYSMDITYPYIRDTVIFKSSSNGGYSFDFAVGIAGSANHLNKVALAYGRSLTYNSGRYFVAWEEKLNSSSPYGHIYTAYTEPNFNSALTTPHMLDSVASLNNKVRNPAIACQFNGADNDRSNLTEVILCENNIPGENRSDIVGFYNKTAATTKNFNSFSVNPGQHTNLQPDISFNPFDSKFMVTYFDSTGQVLPYITHDVNMQNPYSWDIISTGYNDNANLTTPYPKVKLALGQQTGANAWIAERSNANGAAMFDAPFNYPVGVKENYEYQNSFILHAFPNPASIIVNIEFQLPEKSDVKLSLFNSLGYVVYEKTLRYCQKGHNLTTIDLTNFSSGIYLVNLSTYNNSGSRKIVIE